jgi:RsiW-degrading membrane proteinase PrsW (M82 family)
MFSPVLLVAFLCGVLPALLWLAFWLFEDKRNPEPKRYIFFTFLAGMLVVLPFSIGGHSVGIVLSIEKYIQSQAIASGYPAQGLLVLLLWAFVEEFFKFGAAYIAALHWRVFDEPLDAVIYMITAALGFAAAENMLFLASPIAQGQVVQTIITGDLRFVGATLLHVLSSATVGLALAYVFSKKATVRRKAAVVGVVLATGLHTVFNFFILAKGGSATFAVFLTLWLGVVALLLFIERIKKPAYSRRYS